MVNKLRREIHYSEFEDKEKDSDWDVIKKPIILTKKTIVAKSKNKIFDYFPELKLNKAKKVALVLSGGGAKGLGHVGVIKELEKYDVQIDFISGTSMGAIIGAIYALEGNLDIIEKYINMNKKKLISLSDISFSLKGLIKGRAIEDILSDLYGNSTFKDTKIPLVINAVDAHTGKEVVFRSGKIIDAVRASMSIPVVFAPKNINGKIYVDGGVVNNAPYNHVPKSYKTVIVSNVNSKIPALKKNASGIQYFMHFLAIMEHNATHIPNDKRIIQVKPDMKNIYVGDFDKMKLAIKRGEIAAKHVLPRHLKKKKVRD